MLAGRFEQRGLANPGLPADDACTAAAGDRLVKERCQLGQLCVAAVEGRRAIG